MIMATFRYPSISMQYGYVEANVPIDETLSPEDLGAMYADYASRFQLGELGFVEGAQEAATAAVQDGLGASVQSVTENPVESDTEPSEAPSTSSKPWENKPAASPKPWENAAPVSLM